MFCHQMAPSAQVKAQRQVNTAQGKGKCSEKWPVIQGREGPGLRKGKWGFLGIGQVWGCLLPWELLAGTGANLGGRLRAP